jgi:hypothetical protein
LVQTFWGCEMKHLHVENPLIAISVRVYQALLVAYPTKFQQEYGPHMLQVFRDCCLRAVRRSGTNGMVRLWIVTLIDLIQTVVSEHAHKEIEMKKEMKPEDIRRAGWMLMAGGVIFVSAVYSIHTTWGLAMSLYLLSMILLVIGLLGLLNRYSEKIGDSGSILLIGAVFGPLTSIGGLVGASVDENMAFYFFAGPAGLFICLSIFGLVALYTKPLPRWNVLPVIAGLGYPILFVAAFFIAEANGWTSWMRISNIVDHALLILQGLALIGLGYLLKSDAPQELTPA